MCPLCRDELAALPADECGRCRTRYHAECIAESGCATLGCPRLGLVCAACDGALVGPRRRVCRRCGAAQHRECAAARGCRTPACVERQAALSSPTARRTLPPRPRPHDEWQAVCYQLIALAAVAAPALYLLWWRG